MFFLLVSAIFYIVFETPSVTAWVRTPLSNELRWNFTDHNPSCQSANGINPCQDVRTCKFAKASILMGGWPVTCGMVGKGVPKVCCGLPLALGIGLMNKVKEEKALTRECGRRSMSEALSPTENEFFEILSNLPPIDLSQPEEYDPPLDLSHLHEFMLIPPISMEPFQFRLEEFPWMVAIHNDDLLVCFGVLIDRVHILTAAHCFDSDKPDPSRYIVRIGNIERDGGVPFKITVIKIHEKYEPRNYTNNIAILTLEKEIMTPMVPHVCLPDSEIATTELNGKNITMIGWRDKELTGGTNSNPVQGVVIETPVLSNNKCNDLNRLVTKKPESISSDFICVELPKQDACLTTFGGFLFYSDNKKAQSEFDVPWVVVGIATANYSCNESEHPGVFTSVSNYVNWIQNASEC